MPEPTVVKAAEGNEPAEAVGPAPPAAAESSGAVPPAAGAEPQVGPFRTAEALKNWPAVVLALQKSSEAYSSIKQSARIIGWSLSLTEKAVGSVLKFAENKVSSLRPVIQYADKTVSNGVVAIEKKFPAVRESPEKLYDAITQQITKMVRPTLDKFVAISEIGRKKMDRAAKRVVKSYNRFLKRVDRWMDDWEKHLNIPKPEAEPGEVNNGAKSGTMTPAAAPVASAAETETATSTTTATSTSSSTTTSSTTLAAPVGRVRQTLRLACGAATSVAAFYVGAACWLLARAPLVGRVFGEAADTLPSRPPSSSSSSSSSLTAPAASEGLSLSRPLSLHSLNSEQVLSLPPQATA